MDSVWCDVVVMDTYHLLLGKSWQHEKPVIHDETKNTYCFMVDKVKLALLPNQDVGPKPLQGDG